MTTATRTNASNRSPFLLPAYTLAFILPVITVLFAYAGADLYCDFTTNEITAPRMCMGLHQFQSGVFQLPPVL